MAGVGSGGALAMHEPQAVSAKWEVISVFRQCWADLVDGERVAGVGRGGALALHETQVGKREVSLGAVLCLVRAAMPHQEHYVRLFELLDVQAHLPEVCD